MLIRDLTDADLARVLQINEANVPAVGPLDLDRLQFLVAESSIALVVADDLAGPNERGPDETGPNELAGFCLVLGPGSTYDSVNYRWFMDRRADAMYLDRVAFDARFQGRGLGQALYAEVYERMRRDHPELSVLTLEVNVDPPNEPSLRFHARQGFTEDGRQLSKGIEVSLMSRPA